MPSLDKSIVFADGTRLGDRIPGSKYQRSVCGYCRQPIRVKRASVFDVCKACDLSPPERVRPTLRECDLVYQGGRIRDDI